MGQATRTTLVTGSASGIGQATADLLRSRGERVIAVDLREGDFTADLSNRGERQRLIEQVIAAEPTLDAVIACAGIGPPTDGGIIASTNFFGVTELLAGLLPLLQRAQQPRAVAICSIATLMPADAGVVDACLAQDEGLAREIGARDAVLAYAASKLALARWVRRTAPRPDWAGAGVLLNGISPGTVKTPMALPLLNDPEVAKGLREAVPLAVDDYAMPGEIAPLLAFLASAENRFLVGQVPFIDGGSDVLLRGDNII